MKSIVIKISGSVFYWDIVQSALPPLLDVIKGFVDKRYAAFCLVAGGGEPARQFIKAGRKLGANEGLLDDLGLKAAQLNAELIVGYLGRYSYPTVAKSLDEAVDKFLTDRIVVTGGFHPGHSTNAVAALLAERVKADLFLNLTDVDGVYSSDPNKRKDAKKLKSVTVNELRKLISDKNMIAGSYELMDIVAINVIERAKINTRIIKCDPSTLKKAIEGIDVGTSVIS